MDGRDGRRTGGERREVDFVLRALQGTRVVEQNLGLPRQVADVERHATEVDLLRRCFVLGRRTRRSANSYNNDHGGQHKGRSADS